jgi:predicted hotdog family 3-hydroxylacyl-ACP dehydratase
MSYPSIQSLLPHEPPMLWVDEVIAHEQDSVTCRLTLREDHVFMEQGKVEPIVAIEWMAQAVATLVGLWDRSNDLDPRPGFLIAIPEARLEIDEFLLGDELTLRAKRSWGDHQLASFECEVERLGARVATAQLSVYRRALSRRSPA